MKNIGKDTSWQQNGPYKLQTALVYSISFYNISKSLNKPWKKQIT